MVDHGQVTAAPLERSASWALMAQVLLTGALFAAVPYAASMVPFERIYIDGPYNAPHEQDPLYPVRTALIVAGLVIPVLALPFAFIGWRRRQTHPGPAMLQMSLLLSAFVIGWRNYPYYALGIYRAYVGEARVHDFDPVGLYPFRDARCLPFEVGVLLLYPIAAVAVPRIGYRLFHEKKRMTRAFAIGVLLSLATTVLAFASTPKYMFWFMD
ncbi:hypothetical protein FJV41_20940 [Myxococcus llanfairpwllgwyngyllgogerychwyrndrobwllllantysiliogogogochensis]|uniref:Uncharacterized protein n=2 Tax=Myxococcaceae TaxID=31 RepID=A0A540WYA3_9BACT|nr:hypothetical protein FJV41_20940 [Myxococcus llanfairpwllgwyngyllgogerychwyrndrobwllllantysiliogogogochensis]